MNPSPIQVDWISGASMSQAISELFTRQLQDQRAALIRQIQTQRGGAIGRAEATGDPHDEQSGDWTQLDATRDMAIALEEREAAQLTAIDAALQRIDDGTFGLCTACGAELPTARLHANPTALRCVACQSIHERSTPPGTA
jgi:DnaK suppressor protein